MKKKKTSIISNKSAQSLMRYFFTGLDRRAFCPYTLGRLYRCAISIPDAQRGEFPLLYVAISNTYCLPTTGSLSGPPRRSQHIIKSTTTDSSVYIRIIHCTLFAALQAITLKKWQGIYTQSWRSHFKYTIRTSQVYLCSCRKVVYTKCLSAAIKCRSRSVGWTDIAMHKWICSMASLRRERVMCNQMFFERNQLYSVFAQV